MLKKKLFIHQNIPYAFNWNIAHHKQKVTSNNPYREEFKNLGSFFKKIYQGTIPNELFNLRNLPRVSQFKIRGLSCLLYTSPSPRDRQRSRMPSSA